MCKNCDEYDGDTEFVEFLCGMCGEVVMTKWAVHGGFFHGDYQCLGDVFFHDKCADTYLAPLNERIWLHK